MRFEYSEAEGESLESISTRKVWRTLAERKKEGSNEPK